MNDNEKLVLWSILVVLLLIIIGVINHFLLHHLQGKQGNSGISSGLFIYNHRIFTNIQSECFAINQYIN